MRHELHALPYLFRKGEAVKPRVLGSIPVSKETGKKLAELTAFAAKQEESQRKVTRGTGE